MILNIFEKVFEDFFCILIFYCHFPLFLYCVSLFFGLLVFFFFLNRKLEFTVNTNHPIVANVVNNAKKKIETEMTGGLDDLLGAIARVERDPSVLAKTIASSSGAFPASPRSIPLHPSQHQQNQSHC